MKSFVTTNPRKFYSLKLSSHTVYFKRSEFFSRPALAKAGIVTLLRPYSEDYFSNPLRRTVILELGLVKWSPWYLCIPNVRQCQCSFSQLVDVNLVELNFVAWVTDPKTAKLNSPPNFLAINSYP